MSESQSRYSIVERLTSQKLDIITAQSNLNTEVKKAQQKIQSLKEDVKDWEATIKQDVERQKREKAREIKIAERDAKNASERKKAKEDAYKKKIKTIDDALGRIQKISESAPAN